MESDIEYYLHPDGDWRATDSDTYDGAPDGNNEMGCGATQAEARTDLLEQLECALV